MDKEKHGIRNAIIGTVAGGIILALILDPPEFLLSFLSWLWNALNSIFGFLLSILFIQVWLLLLLIILPPALTIFILSFIAKRKVNSWKNYTKDEFFRVKWFWDYQGNSINKPVPISPVAICPNDETRLIRQIDNIKQYHFFCETCKQKLGPFRDPVNKPILGQVIRQIEQRLRTGLWKETMH